MNRLNDAMMLGLFGLAYMGYEALGRDENRISIKKKEIHTKKEETPKPPIQKTSDLDILD